VNEIEWTAKARKQFRRIDAEQRGTIREAVGTLADWPRCGNVKGPGRAGRLPLRVGRYRVLFTVNTRNIPVVVRIEEVKKRDDRTY
jgi:mRNA-degrading endonuclease RelE of RelBE toxin-antitoxin system